jgi:hypothetical protein
MIGPHWYVSLLGLGLIGGIGGFIYSVVAPLLSSVWCFIYLSSLIVTLGSYTVIVSIPLFLNTIVSNPGLSKQYQTKDNQNQCLSLDQSHE